MQIYIVVTSYTHMMGFFVNFQEINARAEIKFENRTKVTLQIILSHIKL